MFCNPLSAKKKPKKNDAAPVIDAAEMDESASSAVAGDSGTAINIQRRERTYFSDVDSNTMHLIEIGSPSSLKSAMSSLQVKEQTEKDFILMAVADGIMRLVWKSEDIQWKMPALGAAANTPYTGALESASNGVYDTSTGNTDFLTYVLPSIVLTGKGQVAPYSALSEAALQNGLQLRPDSVLALYLLGLLYIKTLRYSEALPLLQKAYSLYNGKEVSFALEQTLISLGRKEEAASLSKELASRWPNDIEVLKACAKSAYAVKDYQAAETYTGRLLGQNPQNAEFILLRAKILAAMKDYIKATAMLDMYARQDTSAKDYLLLRAQVLRDWSGNMSAALKVAEDAFARYPKDSEVLLLAASLASATGSNVGGRSASSLADEALLIDPNSEEAMKYKINALSAAGEWQKAYKESSWYLRTHSDERDAIFTHIRLCLELRKNDEAFSLISPIYKANGDDEDVLRSYISVLVRTGRGGEASAVINRQLGSATPAMRSFCYYERSLMQPSQEAALADLRSALIAQPRNKDALFRLYQIYYDNRDYRKAQYYLKQVIALDRGNQAIRRLDEDLQRLVR